MGAETQRQRSAALLGSKGPDTKLPSSLGSTLTEKQEKQIRQIGGKKSIIFITEKPGIRGWGLCEYTGLPSTPKRSPAPAHASLVGSCLCKRGPEPTRWAAWPQDKEGGERHQAMVPCSFSQTQQSENLLLPRRNFPLMGTSEGVYGMLWNTRVQGRVNRSFELARLNEGQVKSPLADKQRTAVFILSSGNH